MKPGCEVIAPKENPNDDSVRVLELKVNSGDIVEGGQIIAVLETTKASFDLEAPESGFLYWKTTENDLVPAGQEIARIFGERQSDFEKQSKKLESGPVMTKKAEKLMKESGLSEKDFPGNQRITVSDVEKLVRGKPAPSREDFEETELVSWKSPNAYKFREIEALTRSARNVVSSRVVRLIDFVKINDLLQAWNRRHGSTLSYLELMMNSAAQILAEFPFFNATYTSGKIGFYKKIQVGFAIHIDDQGLKVPVVKNADQISLSAFSAQVKDLTLKYCRDELSAADLSSGTFTVTDLSAKGVVDFDPVIHLNQSAILGLCCANAAGESRLVLAFDHRLGDGLMGAEFLEALEEKAYEKLAENGE